MLGRRLLPVVAAFAVITGCSGDDSTEADGSEAPSSTVASGSETTDGAAPGTTLPDPCLSVDPADLASLFPGATPIAPSSSPTTCRWPVAGQEITGTFELVMRPATDRLDDVVADLTTGGGEVVELEGLGDRAVYVPTLIVFELGGSTYLVEVVYDGVGIEQPDDPTIGAALRRTADAWAATL